MVHDRTPRRTSSKMSVQVVGDETLIYDESRHKAFCLNGTSATVWNLCDGAHTEAEIVAAANFECDESLSLEVVRLALDELRRDELIEPTPCATPLLSRREMAAKLGAGALVMLPVVAAVLVPKAAQALSGVVDGGEASSSRSSRARRQGLNSGSSPSKADPW